MTDKYAVIGNPIAHSKSPQIHAAFAKQTHQDISYEAVLAPLDGFDAKVQELIKQDYKGVNVTVPFKFEAYNICDELGLHAKGAGAVNTLAFDKNCIKGENTDGYGLVADILGNLDFSLENKDVLILGSGGAANGALYALVDFAKITIATRSLDKARQVIKEYSDVEAKLYEELDTPYDLIINATSVGLTNEVLSLPNIVFAKKCLAYDMMYGRETPFMKQAKANGAQVSDGLGMLVEQAAESFHIWRGVRPQTAPVVAQLRKA